MGSDLLVFAVGGQRLAVLRDAVRELVRAVAITPLPGSPDGVDGVVDLRGEVLPVYDLAKRVGEPVHPVRPGDHMLVCDAGAHGVVIVRADRVLDLKTTDAQVQPLPADPLAAGVVALADGVVVLCDLGAFLSDGDARRVAEALAKVQA